jgi:hypothetical protein
MSACAMQTFNNVTRAAWTCVQAAAAPYGISAADSGQHSVSGFTVAWSYLEASGTLHIQCIDRPWFVSCSTINSEIHGVVDKCLADHNIAMAHMIPG